MPEEQIAITSIVIQFPNGERKEMPIPEARKLFDLLSELFGKDNQSQPLQITPINPPPQYPYTYIKKFWDQEQPQILPCYVGDIPVPNEFTIYCNTQPKPEDPS